MTKDLRLLLGIRKVRDLVRVALVELQKTGSPAEPATDIAAARNRLGLADGMLKRIEDELDGET